MPEHPRSDDELLSSHLDGELTVEEVALVEQRVEHEPDLRQRLDALRAAETLAATPVPPLRAAETDRMVAAALAAGSGAENVTDLAAASARRDRVWPARLATVAAGVVALAITASVIASLGADDDADTAEGGDAATTADTDTGDTADDDSGDDLSFESMTDSAGPADGDMADQDTADMADQGTGDDADSGADLEDAEAAFVPDVARNQAALSYALAEGFVAGFEPLDPDLGEFASLSSLNDAIRSQWSDFVNAPPTPSTTVTEGETDDGIGGPRDDDLTERAAERLDELGLAGCTDIAIEVDSLLDAVFGSATIVLADFATATLDDAAVTVGVFRLSDGQAIAVIIDQTTCALAAERLE